MGDSAEERIISDVTGQRILSGCYAVEIEKDSVVIRASNFGDDGFYKLTEQGPYISYNPWNPICYPDKNYLQALKLRKVIEQHLPEFKLWPVSESEERRNGILLDIDRQIPHNLFISISDLDASQHEVTITIGNNDFRLAEDGFYRLNPVYGPGERRLDSSFELYDMANQLRAIIVAHAPELDGKLWHPRGEMVVSQAGPRRQASPA